MLRSCEPPPPSAVEARIHVNVVGAFACLSVCINAWAHLYRCLWAQFIWLWKHGGKNMLRPTCLREQPMRWCMLYGCVHNQMSFEHLQSEISCSVYNKCIYVMLNMAWQKACMHMLHHSGRFREVTQHLSNVCLWFGEKGTALPSVGRSLSMSFRIRWCNLLKYSCFIHRHLNCPRARNDCTRCPSGPLVTRPYSEDINTACMASWMLDSLCIANGNLIRHLFRIWMERIICDKM